MEYLLVALDKQSEMQVRLDSCIVLDPPRTIHYSDPVLAVNPQDYPFVVFPVDERAQSVLTEEEWASRLATMPAEFLRPTP